MTSPILVTGGTGTLGRLVLARLRAAGRDTRVLSRRPHDDGPGARYVVGDVATGAGLDAAFDGVDTVLHLAGGPKGDAAAARVVADHARRAGVGHLVAISVVGAGAVPLGYFREKDGLERAIAAAGVPWTVLRAAQFHDFVLILATSLSAVPVVPVPRMRLQSVDADEVAARLVDLALGAPAGLVPDLVGPEIYDAPDAVRAYLRARGSRRRVVSFGLPGKVGRAYREGANLNVFAGTFGEQTWADFLAERVGVAGRPGSSRAERRPAG
ncbi:SDR family oxidoreductase [Occultella glacieicola]|uniref:SDR family oxidoreductase n=1 Tax=Occultella glacieicola TaxID=2518684 RepID=A0ABY2E958_9MICO|nr:SDR family oxidoreductase [Occultella glacieicola]TDE99034.1 SDR family oxidoreductase [Occultella glacieicola]